MPQSLFQSQGGKLPADVLLFLLLFHLHCLFSLAKPAMGW